MLSHNATQHTLTYLYLQLDHASAPSGGLSGILVPTKSVRGRQLDGIEDARPRYNGHCELEMELRGVAMPTNPPTTPVRVSYERPLVICNVLYPRRPGWRQFPVIVS